jgi:hypothetical protein
VCVCVGGGGGGYVGIALPSPQTTADCSDLAEEVKSGIPATSCFSAIVSVCLCTQSLYHSSLFCKVTEGCGGGGLNYWMAQHSMVVVWLLYSYYYKHSVTVQGWEGSESN